MRRKYFVGSFDFTFSFVPIDPVYCSNRRADCSINVNSIMALPKFALCDKLNAVGAMSMLFMADADYIKRICIITDV